MDNIDHILRSVAFYDTKSASLRAKSINNEIVTSEAILDVCHRVAAIFASEANFLTLSGPIHLVGDVHGQLDDVLEIMGVRGLPPNCKYLFLGDYVDRGYHSLETILLLMCLKLKHPTFIYLVRGNHEEAGITQNYGFYDEVLFKYDDPAVWFAITDVFQYLPIGATVNQKVLGVHGGITPDLINLASMKSLSRTGELTDPVYGVLWSDPTDERTDFIPSPRNAGVLWGPRSTEHFCNKNDIDLVIRAHQCVEQGYSWCHDQKILTLFSAPNYCYRMKNTAATYELVNDTDTTRGYIYTYDHNLRYPNMLDFESEGQLTA